MSSHVSGLLRRTSINGVPPDEEESVLLSVKDKIRAIDLTTEEQRLEADKEIGKQERRIARGLLHCPGTFSLMVCNVFITTSDVTGLIDRDGATIVVTMHHRLSGSNMRLWYFFSGLSTIYCGSHDHAILVQ
jgi:hypothetical protein